MIDFFSDRRIDFTSSERGCWLWTGGKTEKGYGRVHLGRLHYKPAHRLAWETAHGAIPDGLGVLHKCDVRNCVNPDHLFLGTNADNTADMVAKGRNRAMDPFITAGTKHWQHKLTEDDVVSIRRRIRAGEKGAHLALEFGVSNATVSEAKNGRLWDHVNDRPWSRA